MNEQSWAMPKRGRLCSTRKEKAAYISTIVSMFFQLCWTIFAYSTSRRFQGESGFFGSATDEFRCRRGYEWIPSIAHSVVWTWIIGPYTLWKTHGLVDCLRFRTQTAVCVIAGYVYDVIRAFVRL